MSLKIHPPEDRIAEFCREHGIKTLELFGSAFTADFDDDSDIDLLVDFLPGRTPGLSFFTMADELSAIIGRPVDLLTRRSVEQSENFVLRHEILSHVRRLYEAA